MKNCFALAAALLVAAGCSSFQTSVYEDNLTLPLSENPTDSLYYSLSLEYVSGGLSQEACRQINNTLITTAFDLEEDPGSVEESAIRYRENLIDEYLTENANPELPDALRNWVDEIEGSFTADWNKYKCYTLTYSSFRGGAHGIYTITYLVFNPRTGALVTEDELLKKGSRDAVSALMRENLRASMAGDNQALESISYDQVMPNGNFCPDQKGISWLFQPYDVAPYALGAISVQLSWEQLKPYLMMETYERIFR